MFHAVHLKKVEKENNKNSDPSSPIYHRTRVHIVQFMNLETYPGMLELWASIVQWLRALSLTR